MKIIGLITLPLLVMFFLFTSCGSKKSVTASYPEYTGVGNTGARKVTKVKEELDECEKMSLNAPQSEMRAYASAIDEDRDFARQQAALNARAQMATDIEALVLNVMKNYRGKIKKDGVSTSSADVKQDIASIAEETLKNTRVICSNRYALSDGTYECVVCVSIPSPDLEKIAGAVTLSEDEKLKVEFDAQKFRDSYKEELERFRASKQK